MDKIDYSGISIQVIGNKEIIISSFNDFVKSAEELNKNILKITKDATGSLPSEESFLILIATIIAKIYRPQNGLIQNFIFRTVLTILKLADKLIDKASGDNWYQDLKTKI